MRLLRLFAAIVSLSLRRELAFRVNLLFQLLADHREYHQRTRRAGARLYPDADAGRLDRGRSDRAARHVPDRERRARDLYRAERGVVRRAGEERQTRRGTPEARVQRLPGKPGELRAAGLVAGDDGQRGTWGWLARVGAGPTPWGVLGWLVLLAVAERSCGPRGCCWRAWRSGLPAWIWTWCTGRCGSSAAIP